MLWSVFGCSSTLAMSLGVLAVLLVTAAALLRYGSSHVSSLGSQKRNLFVSRESNTIATTNNFSSSVNASKDSDEKEWVGKFTPLADKKDQQTLQRQACVDNDSIALHVIFLVHGHKGLATDLKYLHTRIESLVASKDEKHFVLVHSSRCNEGKTDDGIQRGGERLAQEMHRFIHLQLQNMQPVPKEVTLSVVGNSLGGLYSRYAVAKLKDILQSEHQVTHLKDKLDAQANLNDMFIQKTPLFFNIFCTTASVRYTA
jgi:predicted lipoprotein with Yx(FWY)xxD motif